jgi:hypothetical protein
MFDNILTIYDECCRRLCNLRQATDRNIVNTIQASKTVKSEVRAGAPWSSRVPRERQDSDRAPQGCLPDLQAQEHDELKEHPDVFARSCSSIIPHLCCRNWLGADQQKSFGESRPRGCGRLRVAVHPSQLARPFRPAQLIMIRRIAIPRIHLPRHFVGRPDKR